MFDKIKKALRIIDTISINIGKIFSFLILAIVFLESMEAILRYIIKKPTVWSWEVALLLYGAHFIMGAAWVLKEEGHVRTEVIFNLLSKKVQAILELILYTCVFFPFIIILSFKSVNNAWYSWLIKEATYTDWGPPLYPLKILIATSFILLLLQGIAKWIRSLVFVLKGEEI